MVAIPHSNIQFYDITIAPSAGDPMKIVTVSVSDEDGDGNLKVGDKIDGKEITKITAITTFRVNPTGGGAQINYGAKELPDTSTVDYGLEYELSDGTKLFIPSKRMNEALVEGTFARKLSAGISTSTSSKFNNYYSGELSISSLLCFFPGTLIATPFGERGIEVLVPGDRVLTADGREVAAKWVCRQTVSTRFGPAERLMPVRFAVGSLPPS